MYTRILFVFLAVLLTSSALAEEELMEVTTPRGATQKFLLIKPSQPKATAILFAGGKGALDLSKGLFGNPGIGWGSNNFLVRTREALARHGLMVATIDAPSDHQGKKGMSGGFRSSSQHVADIDAVIARLREIADVPIWLVGTSRGTESAANIAVNSTQHPDGLVLTSSMTVGDRKGKAVTDFDLSAVRIPTLITHHKEDGCPKTLPGDIDIVETGLSNAPLVKVQWFSGGREQSDPCQAMSHHGYLGIENQVVDAIAQFILENSR